MKKKVQAAERRGSSGSEHRRIATTGEVSRNWIEPCDRKEGLACMILFPAVSTSIIVSLITLYN